MNGKPVSELGDAKLVARAYNLALKLVPNLQYVLTLEQLEFFERNLQELPRALRFGFEPPRGDVVKVHERGEAFEVHLPPTSGRSAGEWVDYLRARGVTVYGGAESTLRLRNFLTTRSRRYRVSIYPRRVASSTRIPRMLNVFDEGQLSVEAACMLRDYLSDSDMVALGLRRIVVAHRASPAGKVLMLEVGSRGPVLNVAPEDLRGLAVEGVGIAVGRE